MVSRDRGSAYASAATKHGKEQVADGFHLVQNIHKTIKDALSLEFGQDLFIREGEGWIRMVDSASEKTSPDSCEQDNNQGLVVIKSAILVADDIERRIQLADLNTRQTQKYKKTMAILELAESGLCTSEIAKRLTMKNLDVGKYRKNAPETIQNVEIKIDEYYRMQENTNGNTTKKRYPQTPDPPRNQLSNLTKRLFCECLTKGKIIETYTLCFYMRDLREAQTLFINI